MQRSIEEAAIATLGYLMTLIGEGTRPDAAKSALRPLQQRYPDIRLQLVWEEDVFDQRMHYDALLTVPGSGIISMSYCNEKEKPWPLRGVQRWSDKNLLRVNNTVMEIDQAVAYIDFIWEGARIADRLVSACLIEEEIERNPITISDQELQAAMDNFRKQRNLYRAEDTYRWMERRGLSHRALERLVKGEAMVGKLRDCIIANGVEPYFVAHSADFDTVRVARLFVSDDATARTLCERIRSGEVAFFDEAQRQFLASHQLRPPGDLFAKFQRRESPPEFREALFQASAGSVLEPLREENGYVINYVLSLSPAVLDNATAESIRNLLFEQWLEERRKAAVIEWLWGNSAKTSPGDKPPIPTSSSDARIEGKQ
jgi:putative peptide maturation system protein